jgi:hypothetical protein
MTVAASLFHATAGIEFIWNYAGAKQLDSRLPIAKFRIAGSRPCNDPGMLGRKARHQGAPPRRAEPADAQVFDSAATIPSSRCSKACTT